MHKPVLAYTLGVAVWLVGFLWGSLVLMIPGLKDAAPIAFVSNNPWISFPLLVACLPLAYASARRYLRDAPDPRRQGLQLGIVLACVSATLDLIVLALLLGAGLQFFASLTVLLGYALLVLVPWSVGDALSRSHGQFA